MSKEIRIAIIAIVSAAILYYGFNFLKGSDFLSRSNYYYAIYPNIGTLAKSNPVKINGVPVGKVNGIKLLPNQGNKVLVSFDVQEDVILGDSSVAELSSDLLGGNSIVIKVGKVLTPKEPGDTIISRIDKGLEEIIESAQPVANNLNLTINRLNELLAEFQGLGTELQTTVKTLDTTLTTVNRLMVHNQSAISGILRNTNLVMTNVNQRVLELEGIMTKTGAVLDSVDAASIANTLKEMEMLTSQVADLTQKINEGEGTIGKLMTDDSLYANLNKLLMDLDTLVVHFDQYPKDFLAPLGRKHKKLKGN